MWTQLLLATLLSGVRAQVQAPLEVEKHNTNVSEAISNVHSGGLLGLFGRQSNCYSPNRYCAKYNRCCGSTAGYCCPDLCAIEYPNDCCLDGTYCQTGKECCNNGCMPEGSQCCRSGGYCPQPFICVLYEGVPGCCTDLTCRVYLSSGVTRTAAQTSFVPINTATTVRLTTTYTTATTSATTVRATTAVGFTRYTTYYYWYYWYYYYTVYYSPSTYTTRERTTVTRYTTLTCSATNTAAAAVIFAQSSSQLPTPAGAQIEIPVTPTSGATVIGRCSSTSTSTTVDDDGYTSRTAIPICQTLTADGKGNIASGGSSATGSGSSGSASGASAVRVGSLSLMVLAIVPALVAGAVIVL